MKNSFLPYSLLLIGFLFTSNFIRGQECVGDTIPPVISSIPQSIILSYCEINDYMPDYELNDNCDTTLTITYIEDIDFECSTSGTRTYYCVDSSGNIGSFIQEIELISTGGVPFISDPELYDTLYVYCFADPNDFHPPIVDPSCTYFSDYPNIYDYQYYYELGTYRARYKVDWTLTNYCGNSITFTSVVYESSCLDAQVRYINSDGSFEDWQSTTTISSQNPLKITADGSRSLQISVINGTFNPLSMSIYSNDNEEIYGELEIINSFPYSVFYYYNAPTRVPEGLLENTVYLEIFSPAGGILGYIPIEIIRPPVLFLHGLWSKGEIWDEWINDMLGSDEYNYFQLYAPSYPNDESFQSNIPWVKLYIDSMKGHAELEGYHCNKVDVIGHSMGSIITRFYAQSNIYNHDINRLISINSPHHGSPLANFLTELPEDIRYFLCGSANLCFHEVFNHAVNDLQTNSHAIVTDLPNQTEQSDLIKKSILASEVGLTETLLSYFGHSIIGLVPKYLAAKLSSINLVDNAFNTVLMGGYPNDLIVQMPSQLSGLNPSTAETYNSLSHMDVHEDSNVRNHVYNMLDSGYDSEYYFQGSYPAPTGELYPSIQEEGMIANDNHSFMRSQSELNILSPSSGMNYDGQTEIELEINYSTNITSALVLLVCNKELYSHAQLEITSSIEMPIPDSFVGRVDVMVSGFDEFGFASFDTTHFFLDVEASLASITISPNALLGCVGQNTVYDVYGEFSDGVLRKITHMPDVFISSAQNLFDIQASGSVISLNSGQDTIIANYNGLQTYASIFIYDSLAWEVVEITPGVVEVECPTIYNTIDLNGCYEFAIGDTIYYESTILEELFITDSGCDSLVTYNINVTNVSPSIVFETGFLISQDVADNYQWLNCSTNTPINEATESVFLPFESGTYACIITIDSCEFVSDCLEITSIPTTVLEEHKSSISVYPNPSKGTFWINFGRNSEVTEIRVIHSTGAIIERISTINSEMSIDLSNLSKGTYFLQFMSNEKTKELQSIVVQ